MALSFSEALQRDLENARDKRKEFVENQEKKAQRRKPTRTGQALRYGTLAAKRNWRIAVREAALRKVQIILTYKKLTTGETKKYVVAPYSYRYRKLTVGVRKMLFAYDMKEKHIKGYLTRNVRKVVLTDRKFRPKWPIEI